MAQQTLGKLVVRLLMDDDDFQDGAVRAKSTLRGMHGGFQGIARMINGVVVAAFKAATAAVVGFGTASAYVGAQFQQAITTVGAISGATAEEMAKLEAQARKLGATTAYSATQSATAMQDLARAGLSTDEIVDSSEAALLLAGSVGAEMSQSTALMAATMSQFNLEATQSGRIADVFSTAMRTTLFDMSSLTEAMKYAGTVGESLGMSLEQTTAAVSMFRNLGLEGSMAGTNFRMAMSAIAKVTPQAEAALNKYGLTASDVNPELHTFAEIMETVGQASLSTADALTIFGTRSGANVKLIASQFAAGTTDFYNVLDGLETSAGSTAEMYATMMDTVVGQWQIMKSAVEELMLVVFDTFADPLKQVLTSLAELAQHVGKEFGASSGSITRDIQKLADQFSQWIDNNKDEVVDAFKAIGDIVVYVAQQIPWLVNNLGNIAVAVAAVYAVVQSINLVVWVGNIVLAVQSLIPVLASVQASVAALMAEIAVATGGFYLLVVAIGAVVTALVGLIMHFGEAAREAQALEDAQARIAKENEAATESYRELNEAALAASKDSQEGLRETLAAQDRLTAAREAELDIIRDVSDEEAALMRQRGELVEFEGQLRTVDALYEEMGEDALPALNTEMEVHSDQVSDLIDEYNEVADVFNTVLALEAGLGANFDRHFEQVGLGSKEAAEEYLANLDKQIAAEEGAIATIEAALQDSRQRRLQEEARANERLAQERERAAKRAADAAIREDKRAAEEAIREAERIYESTRQIYEKSGLDLEMALADEDEKRELAFQRELQQAQSVYADKMALVADYPEEMAEVQAEWEEVSHRMQMRFFAEESRRHAEQQEQLAQQRAEKAKQEADKAAQDRRQQLENLAAMERSRTEQDSQWLVNNARTRRQRIEALELQASTRILALHEDKAKALADADQLTDDERERIAKEYERRELEIIEGVEEERRESNREAVRNAAATFGKIIDGAKKAAQAVGNAFSGTVDALRNIAEQGMKIFGSVTGFAFDMMDAVDELMGTKTEAEEGGALFDTEAAAEELVDGLIEGAKATVDMLIEAAPHLLRELAKGLPDLIARLADAIPELLQTLATELPIIVEAILDALPQVLDALVEALPVLVDGIVELLPKVVDFIIESIPKVVEALSESVPKLIDGVIKELPRLVKALMDALPNVVELVADAVVQIVKSIPDITQVILDAIPSIITSLLEGVTDILKAVFKIIPVLIEQVIAALPDIIMALIDGILDLIIMIAEQLPFLIAAIIELIPDLVLAIVGMIPDIISAVIAAIPQIIMGLIEGLPELIKAIVMLAPTIIVGLIEALPELTIALVKGLITEILFNLPEIIIAFSKALLEGLWEAFKALVDLIKDALFGFLDAFKKKDRDGDGDEETWFGAAWDTVKGWFSGGSSYSGVEYIGATQRVTVHPGEAIVPADGGHRAGTGARRGDGMEPPGGGYLPAPGGGRGGSTQLAVMLNDRVLDEALISGLDGGRAPRVEARLKKVSGTVKGYSRGRFNTWS